MTPAFRIVSGAYDFTGAYAAKLISLTVSDSSGEESDSLTVELEDSEGTIRVPEEGDSLRVAIGYVGALRNMGLYIVESVDMEGPPDRITIHAKAAPFDQTSSWLPLQSRKSRSFDAATVGALVEAVATEHGLTAAIDPQLATLPVPHLDQTDESDMNLLTRIARDNGAIMKAMFGRLVFARRGSGLSISGIDLGTAIIRRSDVTGYRATYGLKRKYKGVKTRSYDPLTANAVDVFAGEDGEKVYSHPYSFATDAEAKQAATSYLGSFQRSSRTVSLPMPGRTDLGAGMTAVLLEFRPQINGQWIVKKAEHHISRAGYQTTIELEAPPDGNITKSNGSSSSAAVNGQDPFDTDGTGAAKARQLQSQPGVVPVGMTDDDLED